MTEKNQDPTSDAVRSDPKAADKNREVLKKNAEEGLKNADGKLPKDEI